MSGERATALGSPPQHLWELFDETPEKLGGLQWTQCVAAQETFLLLTSSAAEKLVGADRQSDYTGTCVWPGGIAAAEYLYHVIRRMQKEGEEAAPHVLELGAGTGLPGLVAARAGAGSVTVTDGNYQIVEALREIVAANGLEGVVTAEQCRWGDEGDSSRILSWQPSKFDLIVAGDVMYGNWRSVLDILLKTVTRLLSERRGARFVLAAAFKRMGVDDDSRALRELSHIGRAAGMKMNTVDDKQLFQSENKEVCGAEGRSAGVTGEVQVPEWVESFRQVRGHLLEFELED